MTREESRARRELGALAAEPRGRELLQLALRGIQTSDCGLTVGCWVKPGGGVSGCVFQHAYWQGVAEGVFGSSENPSAEIKQLVDERDFRLVMSAIRALDQLGRRRFLKRDALRRTLDETAWRRTVERLLVDALAEQPAELAREPVARSV
jgi:hypothetical protein